jgi:hypothetical protein
MAVFAQPIRSRLFKEKPKIKRGRTGTTAARARFAASSRSTRSKGVLNAFRMMWKVILTKASKQGHLVDGEKVLATALKQVMQKS